ncbi:MAG: bifunctional metallophosphatase/5'-nucleotidase [Vicinamibacterales bacterium]
MRRRSLIALTVASACAVLAWQQPADTAGTVRIQLLAINDFHGNLEPPSGGDGRVNTTLAGGAEYLATHLARARAENPYSILVAAGDLIGASPLVSSMYHDEATIEAMNAMQMSISAVGNHELDEGAPELLRMKRGGCHPVDGCAPVGKFHGAKYAYLSANIVRTDTHKTLFPPVAIKKIGGVKIGFIGETLHGTPEIVSAKYMKDLEFLDEATTANAYAAQLKRQGVDVVVLLIHEGGRQYQTGPVDPNGCEAFSGGIGTIASRLSADIPVVISGHNHSVYNCRIDGHLVTNSGAYGRGLTRITLDIDRASGRVVDSTARNETVTRDVPRDPAISRIISRYKSLADAQADRVVGSVATSIVRQANESGESALGDLIADAQLEATRGLPDGGAVVAFMNSGGIRADLVSTPRGHVKAGELTYGELIATQPFGNVVTLMTLSGEQVRRLLEQQFDNPRVGSTTMLQVSNGFTYRYRLKAPAGEHVDRTSIQIDGRTIAPTDRVRVAASDFLFGGGDGFTVLTSATEVVGVGSDIDALSAYVAKHSPLRPGPQDRYQRVD